MTWDAAHVGILTVSAASAAVAVVVATAVALALAQAIVAAFVLGGALPGAFDVDFAFDTPQNGPEQIDDVLLFDEILTANFYVLHSCAWLEHRGGDIAAQNLIAANFVAFSVR